MKKYICFLSAMLLLVLCLLVPGSAKTGLAQAAFAQEFTADQTKAPAQTRGRTKSATITAAPEPAAPTGAEIRSVRLVTPEKLTVTADAPETTLRVRFVELPAQLPAQPCTVRVLQGGAVIAESAAFSLGPGSKQDFALSYSFARYMTQTEDVLTVELICGETTISQEVPVRLENWPDEVYAAQSGDPLPYSIDVLRNQNVVIVYGKDAQGDYTQPVHVFVCSTGSATPRGNYRLGWKSTWRSLFGNVYGQYAMHVTGNILFHSVPYRRVAKNSLKTAEFNKLGTSASMGCIRMMVADVKWIYDFCPCGTPVHIYNTDELPVEKPEAPTLDQDDPRSCWDPTDPDPENPWMRNS